MGRALLLLLVIAAGVNAQEFRVAQPQGNPISPESFTFDDCTLRAYGRGSCGKWRFQVPIDDGDIESVSYLALPSALLLEYDVTDHESSWAKLVRIEKGKGRPQWTFHVPTLNTAPPLLRDDSIYVAGLGYTARIDAWNGWSTWAIDRAYDGKGFERVTFAVEPQRVVVTRHHSSQPRTMVECFDRETGSTIPCSSGMPVADHHQHLLSPATAAYGSAAALPAVELPAELSRLLRARESGWNDQDALAKLYAADAMVLESRGGSWIRGRNDVAEFMATLYARPYRVTPVSVSVQGSAAHIAGYFTRESGHFGHVLFALTKDNDGAWRIAAETPTFPGPPILQPLDAEARIAHLDAAGIKHAAVLSAAYWFGSPLRAAVENEYDKVRAENDWVAKEVMRHPDRLAAFCSFNPLKPYALEELDRCAKLAGVKGLKLHFGNSGIDVNNAEHVQQLRRVFRAANERRLAIVAHLWTSGSYGAAEAKVFLEQLLPEVPDVPVQIAHFAGGGPGYTDEALEVFADAIAAKDPRTKQLYFDIATVADEQSDATLRKFAERIRQIGVERVLFGTDLGPPLPRQSWLIFRTTVPLTDDEFAAIAGNVAPYFR